MDRFNGLSLATRCTAAVYLGAVGAAGVYGLCRGLKIWYKWVNSRKPYRLKNETAEPIVNAAVDGGKLVFDTVATSSGCMFLAATFPVSVPALIYFNQKDLPDKSEKTDGGNTITTEQIQAN